MLCFVSLADITWYQLRFAERQFRAHASTDTFLAGSGSRVVRQHVGRRFVEQMRTYIFPSAPTSPPTGGKNESQPAKNFHKSCTSLRAKDGWGGVKSAAAG